ncbi:MAG: hypothetical protein JW893_08470 [Candidatus Omnitrophica bacterium]|nr:hypothetical protein [Candidatus Omnitrophota bacterium]
MPKKKRKSKTPKPRHTWAINPKSRVKPSGKAYQREKGKKKTWVDEIDWFG